MPGNDQHDFGHGHDFESGQYDSSTATGEKEHIEMTGSLGDPTQVDEVDYVDIEGLILDWVPSHRPAIDIIDGRETTREVTTVYLGSGALWYRVNFWNEVGRDVEQVLSAKDPVSMSVYGEQSYSDDLREVHVQAGDTEASWETSSEPIQYKPTSVSDIRSPAEVDHGQVVPLLIGDVISQTGVTERTKDDGTEFRSNHLTVHSNENKLLASLYRMQAKQDIERYDTVGIFTAWGATDPLKFIPNELLSVDYETELKVDNYGGVCNFSKHEYIDCG